MQELQSLIMLGVRKILNISLHVVHDGSEPLKHAYIDKIMDMWLTSIANFSDGGIDKRKSPWIL
jgi:hypothetical protein